MPFISQAYLTYLENQMSGAGGGEGGVDIPPADLGPEITTAPFGPPGQGGAGSYPAAPTFTPSPSPTPQTPSQWGPDTAFVPMTDPATPAPYQYDDPYGTAAPGNVNIPYPGDMPVQAQPPDTIPTAPGVDPGEGEPSSVPGNLPFPYPGQPNQWTQPTNWQNVGNFFNNIGNWIGNIPNLFTSDPTPGIAPGGSPVGSFTPDAVASGIPLPGATVGGQGPGGMLSSPYQWWMGTHSPAFQSWLTQHGMTLGEFNKIYSGGMGGAAGQTGATQGATHAGQHISPQ